MDVNRFSQGQLIAAASAVLLLIFMFLPWFEIPGVEATLPEGLPEEIDLSGTPGIESESLNAWEGENPLDIFLLLTAIVALAGVLLASSGGGGASPVPLAMATFLLGAIGTLMVLYQVFDVPDDLDRKIGLFLGLIAVAGVSRRRLSEHAGRGDGGALLNRPLVGQWAGALGGAGLLASLFLSWYGEPGSAAELSGWEAFSVIDLVCALAGLAGISVGVVAATRASVSYPVAGSSIACGAGLIALVLVTFRLLDPPGGGEVDRLAGAWLGLVSCIVLIVGGWLGMKELPPSAAGEPAGRAR